jgi:hypothetical protein
MHSVNSKSSHVVTLTTARDGGMHGPREDQRGRGMALPSLRGATRQHSELNFHTR